MIIKKLFEVGFSAAVHDELARQNITVKDLSQKSGIPSATLYKTLSGGSDPRFSTVQKIVDVLEPRHGDFIAVVAARFLLDEIEGAIVEVKGSELPLHGYTANSIDECIIAAVTARREGAVGIICAPILASIVEKIVDIPVAIIKPNPNTVLEAAESIAKRI
jgi:predicted transcriptional regulator